MGEQCKRGTFLEWFEVSSILPRVLGACPFVATGTQFEVSKTLVAYDVLLLLVLFVLDAFVSTGRSFYSTNIIIFLQRTTSTFTLTLSVFWVIHKRFALQDAMCQLSEFDTNFRPKNLQRLQTPNIIFSGFIVFLSFFLFILDVYTGNIGRIVLLVNIKHLFGTNMVFAIAYFFTIGTKFIGLAYENMIDELARRNYIGNMREIQKAVDQLVSASEAWNDGFGLQLLAITLWSFVIITGNIFVMVTTRSPYRAILSLAGVLIFLGLMYYIISNCCYTLEKVAEFDIALYKHMLADRGGQFTDQIGSSLYFTSSKGFEFTAFDIFTVDMKLAGSMIAAAATYLIILIQISKAPKLEQSSNSGI